MSERIRRVELRFVDDPHRADVHRKLAPAARQILSTDLGRDAVRVQIAADQVRFDGMACGVNLLHLITALAPGGASDMPMRCMIGRS